MHLKTAEGLSPLFLGPRMARNFSLSSLERERRSGARVALSVSTINHGNTNDNDHATCGERTVAPFFLLLVFFRGFSSVRTTFPGGRVSEAILLVFRHPYLIFIVIFFYEFR